VVIICVVGVVCVVLVLCVGWVIWVIVIDYWNVFEDGDVVVGD